MESGLKLVHHFFPRCVGARCQDRCARSFWADLSTTSSTILLKWWLENFPFKSVLTFHYFKKLPKARFIKCSHMQSTVHLSYANVSSRSSYTLRFQSLPVTWYTEETWILCPVIQNINDFSGWWLVLKVRSDRNNAWSWRGTVCV